MAVADFSKKKKKSLKDLPSYNCVFIKIFFFVLRNPIFIVIFLKPFFEEPSQL